MVRGNKELVRQYWDYEPCGTRDNPYPVGSLEYFEAIAERRYKLEPFIVQYAQFEKRKGKKVLEVGCGVGTDLLRFAQAGADVYGIDLSAKSVGLSNERLALNKCKGVVIEADAESIPYKENMFDFVYAWGSIHHSPNPDRIINEIYRITKPGGEICVMLYHRRSIVALQMWIMFGLLRGKPFRNIGDILAEYHESPGTKAYTISEAKHLFSRFKNVRLDIQRTPYDLRYLRNKYLPLWIGKLLPGNVGWFLIVRSEKP